MITAFLRETDCVLRAAFITTALFAGVVATTHGAVAAEVEAQDVYRPTAATSAADATPEISTTALETALSSPAAESTPTPSAETVPAAPTTAVATPAPVMMAPIPDESETEVLRPAIAEGAALDQGEEHCLATAIYFEARGESEKGQKAVAEVILRRTKTPGRPGTVCGVVFEGANRKTGCQFSFTCDRASNVAPFNAAWMRAQRIATEMLGGALSRVSSIVRGATFYHATHVSPPWASRMIKVARIGSHVFYRPKAGRFS